MNGGSGSHGKVDVCLGERQEEYELEARRRRTRETRLDREADETSHDELAAASNLPGPFPGAVKLNGADVTVSYRSAFDDAYTHQVEHGYHDDLGPCLFGEGVNPELI